MDRHGRQCQPLAGFTDRSWVALPMQRGNLPVQDGQEIEEVRKVISMRTDIAITMTHRGCEVTVGGTCTRFDEIEAAVRYACQHLQAAQRLLDLSARCE
jgi:hypothetical protein